MKEYENGNPHILLEQRGQPDAGAVDDMKPFAFDLKPETSCEEAEALVAEMRRIVTHVQFEEVPV